MASTTSSGAKPRSAANATTKTPSRSASKATAKADAKPRPASARSSAKPNQNGSGVELLAAAGVPASLYVLRNLISSYVKDSKKILNTTPKKSSKKPKKKSK